MKLLDEIIELAVEDKGSVSVLLRKCLVLAHRLNNERLRSWAEKELDGYTFEDELPAYRQCTAIAKGYFRGPFGASINNQPIPPQILKPEDRHFATSVKLIQPIVSYEIMTELDKTSNAIIEWPSALILQYQHKIIPDYGLASAWQEIPNSVLPALTNTIRNRVLRLGLGLKDDLGQVSDDIDALPKDKVDRQVITYIYGGTNIIAGSAQNFSQIGTVSVREGDAEGLKTALKKLGVSELEVADLHTALAQDAGAAVSPNFGQRTKGWLSGVAARFANAGVDIGVDTAKAEATKLILQYLGLS
jgi:hypothetical protein